MSKEIIRGNNARLKIFEGIKEVAETVILTMGPKAQNIIIDSEFGNPISTNDGVSVAREISFKDKYKNIGASIVKQAAEKTNREAGDGTTTTTVLLYSIVREGMKVLDTGIDQFGLVKGLHMAKDYVINNIKSVSKKISTYDEIKNIATISSQDEEVGTLIADIVQEIGHDGVISVEESKHTGLSKEVVTGMSFDEGYESPYYVTDVERMESIIVDPYILITDHTISSLKEIISIMEQIAGAGKKELVIVSNGVKGEALSSLVMNKMRGNINVVTVMAAGSGDQKGNFLQDVCAITGGTCISTDLGGKLESTNIGQLGRADKVIVTKGKTTIVGGKGGKEELDKYIHTIGEQIKNTKQEYIKNSLIGRKARLLGGVAVIKVGASTEIEMRNKKFKIEDAIAATRSAIEEGIVIGGGCLFATMPIDIDEDVMNKGSKIGVDILRNSLFYPLHCIAQNSGYDPSIVLDRVRNGGQFEGFDAKRGLYVNMYDSGIIDPVKVLRLSLENAVSAAAMVLTTGGVIVESLDNEDENNKNMGAN